MIERYGESEGKKRFAKKYWGIENITEEEFEKYRNTIIHGVYPRIFFDKKIREELFEEQDYKCGYCKVKYDGKIRFDLHHIDYNKENCDKDNLLRLCVSCHMKTSVGKGRTNYIRKFRQTKKEIKNGTSSNKENRNQFSSLFY